MGLEGASKIGPMTPTLTGPYSLYCSLRDILGLHRPKTRPMWLWTSDVWSPWPGLNKNPVSQFGESSFSCDVPFSHFLFIACLLVSQLYTGLKRPICKKAVWCSLTVHGDPGHHVVVPQQGPVSCSLCQAWVIRWLLCDRVPGL